MRLLQLQIPNMTGPDVFDWQTFLEARGLFQSEVDSDFGRLTDLATRAYQTEAGLPADGAVDAKTMARALIDGYRSTVGADVGGMDSDTDCSAYAGQIFAQGMRFVARYYSDNRKKALSLAEARELSSAGLAIVAVFENSNNSAGRFSMATGQAHAATALRLAATIGQPSGTAIYFAVDYDAKLADLQGPVTQYFSAIKTAFDAAAKQYAIAVYGSGLTCRVIRDSGMAKFSWIGASIGFAEYATFRKQADIVQLAPERTLVPGLSIDDNIGQSAEFGAFRLAAAANPS
jgi:peptidoglycan hydrolase-like protein with peptidoglycan-binding domain